MSNRPPHTSSASELTTVTRCETLCQALEQTTLDHSHAGEDGGAPPDGSLTALQSTQGASTALSPRAGLNLVKKSACEVSRNHGGNRHSGSAGLSTKRNNASKGSPDSPQPADVGPERDS